MSSATLPAPSSELEALDERGLVLIVDDEPLLLRSLERILRRDGHRVALCESAEAALGLEVKE